MMRSRPTPSDDGARKRSVLTHLLLRTLFWIAAAVGLFFYFKLTE